MFAVTYACYHQSRALYKHPAFWIRTTTHKIKCSWLKDSLVPLPHEAVFLSKKQGAVSRYVVSVYRHSHYKDKTVVRPSYLLYIGNPITGKTVFLNIMTGPRPLWCREQCSPWICVWTVLTHWGWGKMATIWQWPPFGKRHFQINFPQWKLLYFCSNFTEICSHGSN